MPDGTCSVEGCDRECAKRGSCNAHYIRQRVHGILELKPRVSVNAGHCSAPDCERDASKRGLCGMHYQRMRHHGTLTLPPRMQPPAPTELSCAHCGETKSASEFYPRQRRECKVCTCLRVNRRRLAKLDEIKVAKRDYYQRHKGRIIAKTRAWYWSDPEAARAAKLRYREQNRAKLSRDAVTWKRANPDRAIEYGRKRRAVEQATALLCSREQLAAKVNYWGDACWMCRGPWSEMDHVKPIAKGGPHLLANLRPACRSCNARKSSKWPLSDVRRTECSSTGLPQKAVFAT